MGSERGEKLLRWRSSAKDDLRPDFNLISENEIKRGLRDPLGSGMG